MRATPAGLPVTLTTSAACRDAGAANDALATAPATTSTEARILAIARTRSRWGKPRGSPGFGGLMRRVGWVEFFTRPTIVPPRVWVSQELDPTYSNISRAQR